MKRTISEWQGRDPMDCEPLDLKSEGSEPITIGFIIGMVLLLGTMIGGFLFMMKDI